MEKTFRRYQTRPAARHAFAEAEAAAYLAHQIRVLRTQRGWTQKDLAKQLGTTQAAVSRLEDASYGRISFKTMVALANAFDVAPVLKFVSTIELMRERWVIRRDQLEIPGFLEESERVAFVEPPPRPYLIARTAVAAPSVAETFSLNLTLNVAPATRVGKVGAITTATAAVR